MQPIQNRFYQKPRSERILFQAKVIALAFSVVAASALIGYMAGIYLVPLAVLYMVLSIIAPFFDTPSMVRSGKLRYYSELLLAEREKNSKVVIHGGTLFDYYFVMDRKVKASQRHLLIMQQFCEGILNILDDYRGNDRPELRFVATTYFLNSRSIEKLGFAPKKRDFLQTVLLVFNYPNLLVARSMAMAKLSFPNLRHIRTFETDLERLRVNEGRIRAINEGLKSRIL